jgi:hypothetical protein
MSIETDHDILQAFDHHDRWIRVASPDLIVEFWEWWLGLAGFIKDKHHL